MPAWRIPLGGILPANEEARDADALLFNVHHSYCTGQQALFRRTACVNSPFGCFALLASSAGLLPSA